MYLITPTVFHNGSNYDYHFIIKVLAEEFKKQFTCLGENAETFTAPIEKELTRIDKNGEEITKYITYILQFTDSAMFLASSLSILVNNLSDRIHKIKSKHGHEKKNLNFTKFLEYITFKDDLIGYNYQHKFDKNLKNNNFKGTNFLIIITISLFYYWEKVFILMNIWITGKNSVNYHYLKFT